VRWFRPTTGTTAEVLRGSGASDISDHAAEAGIAARAVYLRFRAVWV
jgi:hypothetical protein